MNRRLRFFKRRAFLMQWQQGRCYICGIDMTTPPRNSSEIADTDATEDHVTPRRAGATVYKNCALACRVCNVTKAHRHPSICEQLYARWAGDARHEMGGATV